MGRADGNSTLIYTSKASALDKLQLARGVVQSASPEGLRRQIAQFAAAIVARPITTSDWEFAFIDLAGGGDGHTFVAVLEAADDQSGGPFPNANGIEANKLPPGPATWIGSQSEALDKRNDAEEVRFDDDLADLFDPPVTTVSETFLAGASQGTRFMGMFVGESEEEEEE